ncbi:MAG: excisionase [Bacteroidetes bacterium GWF2_40_14]|nr:MAG: excisionase [Bacteroidetes bacterium GWF2_40_14]
MFNEYKISLIPETDWKEIIENLKEVKNLLQKKKEGELMSEWIESSEARKMLHVSQKTWQTYRDQRRIPFSQFGRKIYVKRIDLENFMNAHVISRNERRVDDGK